MLIGVDVGGTNSDAVVVSPSPSGSSFDVVSWAKSATTDDVTGGVADVVKKALDELPDTHKGKTVNRIAIGTECFAFRTEKLKL